MVMPPDIAAKLAARGVGPGGRRGFRPDQMGGSPMGGERRPVVWGPNQAGPGRTIQQPNVGAPAAAAVMPAPTGIGSNIPNANTPYAGVTAPGTQAQAASTMGGGAPSPGMAQGALNQLPSASMTGAAQLPGMNFKKGGKVKSPPPGAKASLLPPKKGPPEFIKGKAPVFAKGGRVGGRGDGVAQRGKTRGKMC